MEGGECLKMAHNSKKKKSSSSAFMLVMVQQYYSLLSNESDVYLAGKLQFNML